MELIGVLLKHIVLGITKFFQFVWRKWSLAGVLAVFLVIELLLLYPIYKGSVETRTVSMQDFEIVSVTQTEDAEEKGAILVSIRNYSSENINRPPSLSLAVDDETFNLSYDDYFDGLRDQGYEFYKTTSIPAGTEATIVYRIETYFYDDRVLQGDAMIILDDYSYDFSREYEFELKPIEVSRDAI